MDDIRLFLQVRNHHRGGMENGEHRWYVIGDKKHDHHAKAGVVIGEEEEVPLLFLSGLPVLNRRFGLYTISTCHDSTIYVCGGINYFTRKHIGIPNYRMDVQDVWDAHISCNDDGVVFVSPAAAATATNYDDGAGGWHKCLPPMNFSRRQGCAVGVDGKIFVFGGNRNPYPAEFAEVFHFDLGKWEPVIPRCIMPLEDVRACLALDYNSVMDIKNEEGKKWVILVYIRGRGILFSYDLGLKKWELFDCMFESWANKLVLSDSGTILLAMKERDPILYGYNVRLREWFDEPVRDFHVNDVLLPSCVDEFHLVSLGSSGKFCVVWIVRPCMDPDLSVCCMKFTVYQDGSSLAAKVEPTIVFKLDHGHELVSCLAFAPRQEKKKRGGEITHTEVDEED